MSRSVLAFAVRNAKFYEYSDSGIFSRNGFRHITEDDEFVWVNRRDDKDVIQYVKVSYLENVIVLTSWIKFKGDDNSKEYASEKYDFECEKIEDIANVICEFSKRYENMISEKTIWVLE